MEKFNQKLHLFKRNDWYYYSGAYNLPNGMEPLIYSEGDIDLVVCGTGDNDTEVLVEIVFDGKSYSTIYPNIYLSAVATNLMIHAIDNYVDVESLSAVFNLKQSY